VRNAMYKLKSILALPFLLLAGLVPLKFSRPSALTQNDVPGHAISRVVDLVVLPVTVVDRRGQNVSGLTMENFQVFDDGEPQKIAEFSHNDLPLTVGLVVDGSGSMAPNRSEVVTASKEFLRSSNPADQVFVVNFNEVASLGLPQSLPFTSNVGQLEDAVERGPTMGKTALYDAVFLGLQHLESGTRDKKALVIISDGGDNASNHDFRQIQTMALHDNALIYTIGIISEQESDVDPKLLRKLAHETGGQAYFPTSASAVPDICQQIALGLREQYTLTYNPTQGEEGGKFHTIHVTAKSRGSGKLIARTRTGYFYPGEAGATQN
jgi:Ca-activated chloride channel homolog